MSSEGLFAEKSEIPSLSDSLLKEERWLVEEPNAFSHLVLFM